jgi:hypothetical protein
MRLYVTVHNRPGIIVGYAPGPKGIPRAVVIGLESHPVAVDLADCILPKLPKKLERKIKAITKAETRDAQRLLIEQGLH